MCEKTGVKTQHFLGQQGKIWPVNSTQSYLVSRFPNIAGCTPAEVVGLAVPYIVAGCMEFHSV